MDYAPYGSLADLHPLPTVLSLPVILSYLHQIGKALEFAHNRRFIHRDLKPGNILIGRQNELLLSDFGIATMLHNSTSIRTQTMVGTTPYMAPEQIQGKACEASDQYALGIMVYGWLCGRLPFEGSAMEIIAQHLAAPPSPVRTYNPALSPHIEQVLLKVLAKEPLQRFAAVSDFVAALEQAHADTVKGRPAPPTQPFAPLTVPGTTLPFSSNNAIREHPPKINQAYETLRQQTEANNRSVSYGDIVVRGGDHQIGQVVHVLNEDAWIKETNQKSGNRKTKSAYLKQYEIDGCSIAAAIFRELWQGEYLVWTDERKPMPASVSGGKAILVELKQ